MPTETPTRATRATSAQAYHALGLRELNGRAKEVFAVVLAAQRAGARDQSLTEIREAYERRYGKRIDLSQLSPRLTDLVNAVNSADAVGGRLE